MKKLFMAALAFAGALNAHAAEKHELDGVDITPIVDYFRPQIKTVKKSFTVYNWSANGKTSDSANMYVVAQNYADNYWESFGKPSEGNMYGRGLYTSLDPVATTSYGSSEWRVIEMQIPVGAKILDLALPEREPVSSMVEEVLKHFECFSGAEMTAEKFLSNGGEKLKPSCVRLTRAIFKDALGVDLFAYNYGGASFMHCSDNYTTGGRAFVITSGSWMNEKNVVFYNERTTHHRDRRIMIQTLFLEAGQKKPNTSISEALKSALVDYLVEHPEAEMQNTTAKCVDDKCMLSMKFCISGGAQCDSFFLDPLPRLGGGMITAQAAAVAATNGRFSLLWKDLEGAPKASTVRTWLRENRFGCDDQLPYEVQK